MVGMTVVVVVVVMSVGMTTYASIVQRVQRAKVQVVLDAIDYSNTFNAGANDGARGEGILVQRVGTSRAGGGMTEN